MPAPSSIIGLLFGSLRVCLGRGSPPGTLTLEQGEEGQEQREQVKEEEESECPESSSTLACSLLHKQTPATATPEQHTNLLLSTCPSFTTLVTHRAVAAAQPPLPLSAVVQPESMPGDVSAFGHALELCIPSCSTACNSIELVVPSCSTARNSIELVVPSWSSVATQYQHPAVLSSQAQAAASPQDWQLAALPIRAGAGPGAQAPASDTLKDGCMHPRKAKCISGSYTRQSRDTTDKQHHVHISHIHSTPLPCPLQTRSPAQTGTQPPGPLQQPPAPQPAAAQHLLPLAREQDTGEQAGRARAVVAAAPGAQRLGGEDGMQLSRRQRSILLLDQQDSMHARITPVAIQGAAAPATDSDPRLVQSGPLADEADPSHSLSSLFWLTAHDLVLSQRPSEASSDVAAWARVPSGGGFVPSTPSATFPNFILASRSEGSQATDWGISNLYCGERTTTIICT